MPKAERKNNICIYKNNSQFLKENLFIIYIPNFWLQNNLNISPYLSNNLYVSLFSPLFRLKLKTRRKVVHEVKVVIRSEDQKVFNHTTSPWHKSCVEWSLRSYLLLSVMIMLPFIEFFIKSVDKKFLERIQLKWPYFEVILYFMK